MQYAEIYLNITGKTCGRLTTKFTHHKPDRELLERAQFRNYDHSDCL